MDYHRKWLKEQMLRYPDSPFCSGYSFREYFKSRNYKIFVNSLSKIYGIAYYLLNGKVYTSTNI